jgi:hypothetical protein
MRIRQVALINILNYCFAPCPIQVKGSMAFPNTLIIRDGGGAGANNCAYDVKAQRIIHVSKSWKDTLNDMLTQQEIYHYMVMDMPEFCKHVPPETWFLPEDAIVHIPKKSVLPPHGPPPPPTSYNIKPFGIEEIDDDEMERPDYSMNFRT